MNKYSIIQNMVRESQRHADDLSADRVRAMEYYRGEMKDTPADEGRSRMTTRDVRAQIKKALPSICRTILGNDEVVEYLPGGEGDEETAAQATDYINYVVLGECGAHEAIYDAVHDALLVRNGILKWWFEEKKAVKISRHTGLDDNAFGAFAGGQDVEVLEHSEYTEAFDGGEVLLHDVKIKRVFTEKRVRVSAVPRERFLIHPDAVSLQESLLVGECNPQMRRSDLVAMGYDRDIIDSLPVAGDDDSEEYARRDAVLSDADESERANQPVDYYDLFVRVDMDGDGIAELHHMVFAGGLTERHMLLDEECDDVQYCDIAVMRQPHQWEGISLADDTMDIQRSKTVLLRQTLDNIYWQNQPQPIVSTDAVQDPESILNPEFGLPIKLKSGYTPRDAIDFRPTPFVARETFGMMEYLDAEAQDRTGITDASSGLAPDALQNMTAKASAMIEQAGVGQIEMMVGEIANGLTVFFKGLLRLIIRHQDFARTVRLRDKWVSFDPRHWNAEMDAKVNTGLGAGTRERDMMMMQQVLMLQEKMLAGFGPDNPFVKPENIHNALSKLVESAGLRTPSLYFTEPDPMEVQQKLDAIRNAPDPEAQKLQAQMQMEQAKLQGQMQLEQGKMASARDKEMAQMEADLSVKRAEIAAKSQELSEKLAADAAINAQKLQFEREKLDRQEAMRREEMAFQAQMEALKVTGAPKEEAQEEKPAFDQGQAFMALAQAMTAPKQVKIQRDANGDIIGGTSEPVLN